jgi:hypothetical protein
VGGSPWQGRPGLRSAPFGLGRVVGSRRQIDAADRVHGRLQVHLLGLQVGLVESKLLESVSIEDALLRQIVEARVVPTVAQTLAICPRGLGLVATDDEVP